MHPNLRRGSKWAELVLLCDVNRLLATQRLKMGVITQSCVQRGWSPWTRSRQRHRSAFRRVAPFPGLEFHLHQCYCMTTIETHSLHFFGFVISLDQISRESCLPGLNPNDDPPTLKRYFVLDGNPTCLEPSGGELSWYCRWKRGNTHWHTGLWGGGLREGSRVKMGLEVGLERLSLWCPGGGSSRAWELPWRLCIPIPYWYTYNPDLTECCTSILKC